MMTIRTKKKRVARRSPLARCRICGCTHLRPCAGGCGWAEADLCTVCAEFRQQLQEYIEHANRVTAASLSRLLREAA